MCACVCVCVSGCLALTSSETHLSHSTEDGSGEFVFVSGALPSEHMVLDWCERVCVCVCLRVYPCCEW